MPARGQAFGAMLTVDEASRRLRDTGARMTAQRRAVLGVLADNRTHPTAEMIVSEVEKRLGCVAGATIYNTLEALEGLGFVRRIDGLEQRAHFDPDTSDHAHAICLKCKRVWDVAPMSPPSDLPEGFAATESLIQGVCRDCRPGQ